MRHAFTRQHLSALFSALIMPLGQHASLAPPMKFERELIVWNVGQGQWASLVTEESCRHFDIGGEFAPWMAITALCASRHNEVYLSHWDLDHVDFLWRAAYRLKDFCLHSPPPAPHKKQVLEARSESIARCTPDKALASTGTVAPTTGLETKSMVKVLKPHLYDASSAAANELSRVIVAEKRVLVPGDSTMRAERSWLDEIPSPDGIRVLILGHHGSRTSTSDQLLKSLPLLRQAVASSRESRYGHPHREVRLRLLQYKIALLKTEDWGNIHFELGQEKRIDRGRRSRRSIGVDEVSCMKRLRPYKAYIPYSNCERPAHSKHSHRKH
jgi:competence protein ComEC